MDHLTDEDPRLSTDYWSMNKHRRYDHYIRLYQNKLACELEKNRKRPVVAVAYAVRRNKYIHSSQRPWIDVLARSRFKSLDSAIKWCAKVTVGLGPKRANLSPARQELMKAAKTQIFVWDETTREWSEYHA